MLSYRPSSGIKWHVCKQGISIRDLFGATETHWFHIMLSTDLINVVVNRLHEPWWRHQMETFSSLLVLCEENSPVSGEFPTQRPVTRSNRDAGDLRCHCAHYDVTVMCTAHVVLLCLFCCGYVIGPWWFIWLIYTYSPMLFHYHW